MDDWGTGDQYIVNTDCKYPLFSDIYINDYLLEKSPKEYIVSSERNSAATNGAAIEPDTRQFAQYSPEYIKYRQQQGCGGRPSYQPKPTQKISAEVSDKIIIQGNHLTLLVFIFIIIIFICVYSASSVMALKAQIEILRELLHK